MSTVATLLIEMATNLGSLRTDMNAAYASVDKSMGRIEKRMDKMSSHAAGIARTVKYSLIGAFAGFSLQNVIHQYRVLADEHTRTVNTLKLARGDIQKAMGAYDEIYAIALRSRSSFAELADLYGKVSRSVADMGISHKDMLIVTEAVGNSMAITGGNAESMKGALLQLTQGLASGVLRGQEFNSVVEQTPRLAMAIADGLNIPIGKLREYANDGKLTSEVVVGALKNQAAVLAGEVSGSMWTFGQAMENVKTQSIVAIGKFDELTGATKVMVDAIRSLGDGIGWLGSNMELVIGAGTALAALLGVKLVASVGGLVAALGLLKVAMISTGIGALIVAAGLLAGYIYKVNQETGSLTETLRVLANDAIQVVNIGLSQLNWLANALTGNIFGFNENVNFSITALKGQSEQIVINNQKLTEAEARYKQIKIELQNDPGNGFLRGEMFRLGKYIGALQEAQLQQRILRSEEQRRSAASALAAKNDAAIMVSEASRRKSAQELATRAPLAGLKGFVGGDMPAPPKGRGGGGGGISEAAREAKKLADDYTKAKASVDEMVKAIQFETSQLALNNQEREIAAKLREIESKGIAKGTADYAKYADAVRRAVEEKISAQAKESAERILIDLKQETEALSLTNQEREIAIKLRELEQAGMKKGSAEYEAYARSIREAIVSRDTLNASIEVQKKAQENWRETWDNIAKDMTDALLEGGTSVKDYLKKMFKDLVLRPIIAPIMASITGGLSSAVQAAVGGGQSGGGGIVDTIKNLFGGGGQSGGGILNTIKSAYDAISGGFASLGDKVAFMSDKMGSWLVNNTSGMLNKLGGSMMSNAGALGTAASYLGGAAAGFALGKLISGKYSVAGKSGNTAVAITTAIGALFGPLGALLGGVIGGIVNRAFGRGPKEVQASGLVGTLTTDSAMLQQYSEWRQKGGWFRSDKKGVDYSPADAAFLEAMGTALKGVTDNVKRYADVLGLDAKRIDGFTQSVKLNLKDMNQEQQQKAIEDMLKGFADGLAQQYIGSFVEVERQVKSSKNVAFLNDEGLLTLGRKQVVETVTDLVWVGGEFSKAGETAYDTLSRLGESIVHVNGMWDTLGYTLLEGLKGADIASKLIDQFGGAEQMSNAVAAYYSAYYSEEEKLATRQRQMKEVFEDLNLTMPDSIAAYRKLVESQDVTTEKGREMYAALIQLAPAFNDLKSAAKDATNGILAEIERLRGAMRKDAPTTEAALLAQFATLTAKARAGDRGALDKLPEISQALEEYAMKNAVTAADIARVRAQLANSLERTMGIVNGDIEYSAPVPPPWQQNPDDQIMRIPRMPELEKGTGEVRDSVVKMNEDIKLMRNEILSVALHTSKTAQMLDRVIQNGDTMRVTTV